MIRVKQVGAQVRHVVARLIGQVEAQVRQVGTQVRQVDARRAMTLLHQRLLSRWMYCKRSFLSAWAVACRLQPTALYRNGLPVDLVVSKNGMAGVVGIGVGGVEDTVRDTGRLCETREVMIM